MGNTLQKMCHDEILAVFNTCSWADDETVRPVSDVLIRGNSFTMREGKASSSVMALTTTRARNVLFERNTFETLTWGGLLRSTNCTGVVVRDNDIHHTRSVSSKNFLLLRGSVDVAEDNRIEHNTFSDIGATRGKNGYRSTIHPTLGEVIDGVESPGAGVGGNAVFARGANTSTSGASGRRRAPPPASTTMPRAEPSATRCSRRAGATRV